MVTLNKSSEVCLSALSLSKSYASKAGEVRAYENVSLSFHSGQMTLLKGPSGSGKTSLLASLGGLLSPTKGTVEAFDTQIWSLNERELSAFRAQHCGYVFQSVGLFPSLTALEQIIIPLKLMGYSEGEATLRADRVLDEVGMSDRRLSRPDQLSGGQNQRVAVARMLAKRPKLIFCDEPTSSLDLENSVNIGMLLRSVSVSRDAAIICVTHDSQLIACAHRVIEIEDGRVHKDYLVAGRS